MSVVRKLVVSLAALFLGLSGMVAVTGTASAADNRPAFSSCEDDWHSPCP
jgi:hypothetical protein